MRKTIKLFTPQKIKSNNGCMYSEKQFENILSSQVYGELTHPEITIDDVIKRFHQKDEDMVVDKKVGESRMKQEKNIIETLEEKALEYNWDLKELGYVNYPDDVTVMIFKDGYNEGYADAMAIDRIPSDEMITKIINMVLTGISSIEDIKERLYNE